jgi:hypothetical protein
MGRLPLELVVSVLELAFFTDDRFPDRKTLGACSRICRDWRDPAQQLLFRYVNLQRNNQPLSMMMNIFGRSPRGKLLGSYVRSIDIRIGPPDSLPYTPQEFSELLVFFPRLYELHLNSFEPEFDQDTMEKLHALSAIRPIPLRLRCLKWFGPHPQSRMVYQLLSIWPTIRFLYIGNPLSCEPPAERPDFSLYEIGYIRPPTTEVLDWLIPNHSIRIVYLQVDEDTQETDELFGREGPYLRSVRLASYCAFSASLVACCPRLEELSIGKVLKTITNDMLVALPPTIEHLRIREDPESVQSILVLLRSLPRLRVITLSTKTRSLQDVRVLEEECIRKGVNIVYTSSAKNVVCPLISLFFARRFIRPFPHQEGRSCHCRSISSGEVCLKLQANELELVPARRFLSLPLPSCQRSLSLKPLPSFWVHASHLKFYFTLTYHTRHQTKLYCNPHIGHSAIAFLPPYLIFLLFSLVLLEAVRHFAINCFVRSPFCFLFVLASCAAYHWDV